MRKFSVIIPAFNSAKFLKKNLSSIVRQKYKNIEIIIINDGSTDNSQEIIDNFSSKYSNIKSYNISNHGQSFARNYGLSKASGNYISFVDSDDYIDVDTFYEIDLFLNNNDYDIVIFDFCAVTKNDEFIYSKKFNCFNYKNVTYNEYLFGVPSTCNKVFKKESLDQVNFKFLEGIIYEDYCYIPTMIL